MFGERLSDILELLGLTNRTELAQHIGCHGSYISHLLRGIRVPQTGRGPMERLLQFIYETAASQSSLDDLAQMLGAGKLESREQYLQAIESYLYADNPSSVTLEKHAGGRASSDEKLCALFGQRIGIVMGVAGLTNARLAKLMNTDGSVISKYRNGRRSPLTNRSFVMRLCGILYRYSAEHGKLPELAALTCGNEDGEISEQVFSIWLCGEVVTTMDEKDPIFSDIPLLALDDAAGEELEDATTGEPKELPSVYIGTDGLRKAVLRFLSYAAKSGGGTMLLYSDMNMDWMTGSKDFFCRWYSLMHSCAFGGVKIQIIHNIDRRRREMAKAVRSWLPLYMSGNIQSFYSTSPCGNRFSHTLFLFKKYPGGVFV